MKHVFIINGHKLEYKDALAKRVREVFKNEDYCIEFTQYPHHATKIAEKYAKNYKDIRIYACGGDGTVHEVANGLYPYKHVQMAIVPIGTGNDYVRGFGYERSDFSVLENYLEPTYLWVDLIKVTDKTHDLVAVNCVSLGFDVTVAQNVDRFKKFANYTNPYNLALVYCLTKQINQLFKISIDGKVIKDRKYMFVVIGNGAYYGGGYKPCPQASVADGYLDLCMVFDVPLYRIPDLSKAYEKGEHLRHKKYTSSQLIKNIQFLNEEEVLIGLDGEIHTMHQPYLEILPQQIQLCIPKKKVKA